MVGEVGQGEVTVWCSVYKHAVVTKILCTEPELSIPFMCCFSYFTYVDKGFFVYVQLSKYQYEATTDIHYKTSGRTHNNSEKNPIKTNLTELVLREIEHIHSF